MDAKSKKTLQKFLGEYFVLTDRGNSAILLAFMAAKKYTGGKYAVIPDQGGWMAYEKLAKKAGLEVYRVKTKDGVIDGFKELDSVFKELGFENVACVILAQPAGYCLNQDLLWIGIRMGDYYHLEGSNALLIVDVSGSVGADKDWDGDIHVASFREWKPVDLGFGGFIAADDTKVFDMITESKNGLDKDVNFDEKHVPELIDRLKNVKNRYEFFWKHCRKIKKDLQKFDVLWDKGIVVIVKYKNPEEKKEIIEYCKREGYEYTECPREIRVNDKAISIEVKRLRGA
ncbi:hypothetical protein KY337_01760 [Candidatus Woesearchaeota archaeon]|nr:hypothetical protein [Candidatus Woesearchaeota archaeon]